VRVGRAEGVLAPRRAEGGSEVRDGRLKRACQDFEALLLSRMLKEMWRYPGGSAGSGFKVLQELSIEEVSAFLCQSGGIGVWRVLYDQLRRTSPGDQG